MQDARARQVTERQKMQDKTRPASRRSGGMGGNYVKWKQGKGKCDGGERRVGAK